MRIQTGRRPAPSEVRSWRRSIPALRSDLIDAGLGSVEMLIEYQLPLSSKRADVVLAGNHPQTGEPSYVVVELKQWSEAQTYPDNPELALIKAYGGRPVLHPSVQVLDYCDYLADFNGFIDGRRQLLSGVAYLHNAVDKDVADLLNTPARAAGARMFTSQRRSDFVDYLRSRLDGNAPGRHAADALVGGRTAPSRQLLALAAEEVQRREQFVLLDEQRVAFELVVNAVARARRTSTKTAVIVRGGPGSGKSVIALSLLGELSRQGRSVVHATGSRSFTITLRKLAGARNPRVARMFKYFNQFIDADTNDLDCLILDEAHRIRETSVSRYTPKNLREQARSQVDELLSAAKVPVFLLDQDQVVRPGEMGTAEEIRDAADRLGLIVDEIDLASQFRCGGSEVYVDWVRTTLGLAKFEGAATWQGDERFGVVVVDSPEDMEARLGSHQQAGYSSRMAAGFCWPWSDPRADGSLVPDVSIGSWQRPWNLKGERSSGGAPPAALWATDPSGFGQVGCIYTAQGFEYDYAGVIFGPDLVWRNGRWVAIRTASKDPDFRSRLSVEDARFERLILNVYKVLMTRGMRGTYLYSTDPETQNHFRALVPYAEFNWIA